MSRTRVTELCVEFLSWAKVTEPRVKFLSLARVAELRVELLSRPSMTGLRIKSSATTQCDRTPHRVICHLEVLKVTWSVRQRIKPGNVLPGDPRLPVELLQELSKTSVF